MYYTIYKVTNLKNGKFYIGKHQTKYLEDGYMGSGKLIKRAIAKYGVEFFTKEILHICDSEEKMNQLEKELVVISEQSYNLCEGGKGGFSYINRTCTAEDKQISKARLIRETLYNDPTIKEDWDRRANLAKQQEHVVLRRKESQRKYYESNSGNFLGKSHSAETKHKISEHNKSLIGEKNSQYGTCWITNGIVNKKISKEDLIPEGYFRGRKF